MTLGQLRTIWTRTKGHCHFCGDPVMFERRGWAVKLDGHWEVDHVIQRGKGGPRNAQNCLPACTRCNRLRWHRVGAAVRQLLELGLIAREQIQRRTLVVLSLITGTMIGTGKISIEGVGAGGRTPRCSGPGLAVLAPAAERDVTRTVRVETGE